MIARSDLAQRLAAAITKGEDGHSILGLSEDELRYIANLGAFMLAAGSPNAKKVFTGLCALAPSFYAGPAGLGCIALQEDDLQTAEQMLSRALRLCNADAAIYANYAETLQRLGRHVEAQQSLQEALKLDPDGKVPCTLRVLEFMHLSDIAGE